VEKIPHVIHRVVLPREEEILYWCNDQSTVHGASELMASRDKRGRRTVSTVLRHAQGAPDSFVRAITLS